MMAPVARSCAAAVAKFMPRRPSAARLVHRSDALPESRPPKRSAAALPRFLHVGVREEQRTWPLGVPVFRFSFRPPFSISRASAAGTTGCAPSSSAKASRLIPAGRCSFSLGLGAGSAGPPPVRGTPRMSARRGE